MLSMLDENREYHQAMKLLTEGNYFGEISILYKCPRTADVSSKNFVTLASIERVKFH